MTPSPPARGPGFPRLRPPDTPTGPLLPRCNRTAQTVKIVGLRTLYIDVYHAGPAEVFLFVKGPDCSSELIGLSNVIAPLMCIALQCSGSP